MDKGCVDGSAHRLASPRLASHPPTCTQASRLADRLPNQPSPCTTLETQNAPAAPLWGRAARGTGCGRRRPRPSAGAGGGCPHAHRGPGVGEEEREERGRRHRRRRPVASAGRGESWLVWLWLWPGTRSPLRFCRPAWLPARRALASYRWNRRMCAVGAAADGRPESPACGWECVAPGGSMIDE